MITKKMFLSSVLKQISQVYIGKRNCCRCGCGGKYFSTTFMIKPRSEVNDIEVTKTLTRAKNLVLKGAEFDSSTTYFDVKSGKDRSLTFYFDEVK